MIRTMLIAALLVLLTGCATPGALPPPKPKIACPNIPGKVYQPEYGDLEYLMCFGSYSGGYWWPGSRTGFPGY